MASDRPELLRTRMRPTAAFSPSAPVTNKPLFAGRRRQIIEVMSAVTQAGQHVALCGERGVGKTSLAAMICEFWTDAFDHTSSDIAIRINCDAMDTFGSLWAKIAEELEIQHEKKKISFGRDSVLFKAASQEIVRGAARPNIVRRFLELSGKKLIIVDEFDRIRDEDTLRLMADTIKTLSDHLVETTLVLVGVADGVGDLIKEHTSIDRALVQVLVPRMSALELAEIVQTRLQLLGMNISDEALECIVNGSQGLPNYAHLLGLYAVGQVIEDQRRTIELDDARATLKVASGNAHESIRLAYNRAAVSGGRGNLYKQVLLACARAPVDELGFFAPTDVNESMGRIMKKRYEINAFVRHLNALCTEAKGNILQKSSVESVQRFRFADPLMKPYINLLGFAEGAIDGRTCRVEQFGHRSRLSAVTPNGSLRNGFLPGS